VTGLFARVAAEAPTADPPLAEKPTRLASSNPASGRPEAIEAGHKLYFMWCVQCHGPKADGVARFGKYAGDLRAFWRGYREFVTIVKNGRPQQQMPPWKEVLSETQIAQLGAYLETLAIEAASWK
jgi:mono/diheme cytochrome c family protein